MAGEEKKGTGASTPEGEKRYGPGMSSAEMMEKLSKAMAEEYEAERAAPKVFKKGEMLEEMPGEDLG